MEQTSRIDKIAYRNENCIIQRNLGVPLYNRCIHCKSTAQNCMGMRFNLTAGVIIFLSLLMTPMGAVGHYLVPIVTSILLIVIGSTVNKFTDDLVENHFKLDLRNRELSILLDTSTAIAKQQELNHIMDLICHRVQDTLECTFVKILIFDGENKCHVVAAHASRRLRWQPAIGDCVIIEPGSLIDKATKSDRIRKVTEESIRELRKDESLRIAILGGYKQVHSLYIAPISIHDEFLGMIIVAESKRIQRTLTALDHHSGSTQSVINHASMAAAIAIKNSQHYSMLEKTHLETIISLAEALETRDSYTRGHSDRTVEYAKSIAEQLGLSSDQRHRLQYAAVLHDIGKIGIPDHILNKPSKLTDEEFALMKTHSVKGADLASKIGSLESIAPIIRHHHERWDGFGYPDGLSGEEIPVESRIVCVLDSYDAMTSDRIYRKAPGREFAINELNRCSGTQFDPRIVAAFIEVLSEDLHEEEQPYLENCS